MSLTNEERIHELEWQVKDQQTEIDTLHARVAVLEKMMRERLDVLEETVRMLCRVRL